MGVAERRRDITPGTRARDRALARRLGAVASLVAAAVAYVGSRLFDWQSCTDELAQVGTDAVVTRCSAISALELAPLLALALLLMLPDLSELSIPGLGSIKLRLDEQAAAQTQIKDQLSEVLQAVTVGVAQETTVSQGTNFFVVNPGATLEHLPGKAEQFRNIVEADSGTQDAPPATGSPTASSSSSDIARLGRRLLRIWDEWIAPYAALGRAVRSHHGRTLLERYAQGRLAPSEQLRFGRELDRVRREILQNPQAWEIVAQWSEVFADEIDVVRGTRNAVAHPASAPQPDDKALEETITIAENLVDYLQAELPVAGPIDRISRS